MSHCGAEDFFKYLPDNLHFVRESTVQKNVHSFLVFWSTELIFVYNFVLFMINYLLIILSHKLFLLMLK